MATDPCYYPDNGQYMPFPDTIYAEFRGRPPNPCRKYHVSSAIEGAETVASIVLPELARRDIFHKVVQSRSMLSQQMGTDQAGKFITIYMSAHVSHRNPVITGLAEQLQAARQQGRARPGHKVPQSRPHHHKFIEMPLDEGSFIYGGSVVDPKD